MSKRERNLSVNFPKMADTLLLNLDYPRHRVINVTSPVENITMDMIHEAGMNNAKEMDDAPTLTNASIIQTVVLSTVFFISLIGNVATMYQMYRLRRRKSIINTLILHLAIADLIVTCFCVVTDAVWSATVQWRAGNAMCKIIKYLQVFGLYLSTFITVVISLDRCCAILDPMSRNRAPQRVRIMLITSWILSALFSIPQVSDI